MGLFLMLSGLGGWLTALILAREGYQLALTGTNCVDGDNGVLTVLEFGRVLVVNELGTEKKQFLPDHDLAGCKKDRN